MHIIIPASGIGKRFIDAGYSDTKPLVLVDDSKRIIDYVFDTFNRQTDNFIVISSPSTYNVMNDFLESANLNTYTHILDDGQKLGPVQCVLNVLDKLKNIIDDNEECVVSYCDYGLDWNYDNFLNFINTEKPDCVIPCYTGFHPHLMDKNNVYAACFTHSSSIYDIKEKYNSNDRYNELWSPGLYYFKNFIDVIESFKDNVERDVKVNNEFYISLACKWFLNNNKKCLVYTDINKFYQLGTPKDLEEVKINLKRIKNKINNKSKIDNTVILSAGKGERFLNLGFKQPKPFLPIGSNSYLIKEISNSFVQLDTKIVYCASDSHTVFWESSKYKPRYVESNKIGACYSYRQTCIDLEGSVLISPCDLIGKMINNKFEDMKNKFDAIIFTSDSTKFNNTNSKMFSWVSGNDTEITNIGIKEKLTNDDEVLIGSFFVKDNKILIDYIDKIMNNNEEKIEYHLDLAFKKMFECGKYRVGKLNIGEYFSFGSPEEYKISEYWIKE